MQLILATNNQNKLREIREMLSDTALTVCGQYEAGVDFAVEENGVTFIENAEIKAQAIFDRQSANNAKCYVLADDSGLCVDALDGAPGVYSHRFAGEDATDAQRCEKLLSLMKNVPKDHRGAHFACAMCLITPDGTKYVVEGKVEGEIGYAPHGENGFGYDPVFEINGRSFAEFTADEKNAVSHRRRALEQVVTLLMQQNLSGGSNHVNK